MRTKKQTLRRITLLYVIYFAVIVISLVLSFGSSFGEGFNTGYNDAHRLVESGVGQDGFRIVYNLPGKTSDMDFNIPVYSSPDGTLTMKARPSFIDLEAVSRDGKVAGSMSYTVIFGILAMLTYAAIFVILFLILRSLRRSIRGGDMFDKSNIARTRLTGILLICASLLLSITSWIESREAAPYFEGSTLAVNTSFPFNFTEIIIGVLIFVVAEVFAIGYSVSEEQKLTI